VNAWGRKFQKEEQAQRLIFLNRHRERFDWDNGDSKAGDEVAWSMRHPHLAAKMPGVALERHLPDQVSCEDGAVEIDGDDDEEALVAEALANNTLLAGSTGVHLKACLRHFCPHNSTRRPTY